MKTAAELGALRGPGGTGVSGLGRGCFQARGGGPGPSGGRSPNKGSLGRPLWRPSQLWDPAPPTASCPAFLVSPAGPRCRRLGCPLLGSCLCSRCGRERPCPTAPGSPARPSRECDFPSHSPLGIAAQPPPTLLELLDSRHQGRPSPRAPSGFSSSPGLQSLAGVEPPRCCHICRRGCG